MGFWSDVGSGIKSAATGTVKALDPTSNQSFGSRLEDVGRGTVAFGTGGLSEVARQATGKGNDYLKSIDPTKKPKVETLDPNAANQVKAARVANIRDASPASLQRTNMDLGQSDQARQQQLAAMGMAQQSAMGQGPSAASVMAQIQGNRIAQQQMAAATSRGFNPAAQRGAMYQGAQAQSDALQTAALARAQEQMAAQQNFGQQAQGLRATDLGQAQSVAELQAQQNQLQAQMQQQANMQRSEFGQQRALTQAQLQQQAALANQAAMEQRALGNIGALNNANMQSAQARQAMFGGVLEGVGKVGAAFVGGKK